MGNQLYIAAPLPIVAINNPGFNRFWKCRLPYFLKINSKQNRLVFIQIIHQLIGNGLSIPYPQRDLHVYHHDADGRPLSELALRGVADDGDLPRSQPPKG